MIRLILFCWFLLSHHLFITAQPVCDGNLGESLIQGDFGIGVSDFLMTDPFYSSELDFVTAWPETTNTYAVAYSTSNSPASLCWISTADNSGTSNGYMLIANVEPGTSSVYHKTIEVCDGIRYILSIDAINLSNCSDEDTPVLSVFINGEEVLSTGIIPPDGEWQAYSELIVIPEGTDIAGVEIKSLNGGSFAIDNIQLRHCGPQVDLPSTTIACPDNYIVLSPSFAEGNYANPYYQWQQSFDGGNSWTNMANENSELLEVTQPVPGIQYRVQIANGPVNFINESCRVTSTATAIVEAAPSQVYLTPTICEGDTLIYHGEAFVEAGNYIFTLPGDTACDSIVHLQLFTYPVYEQWYSISLCEGERYEDMPVYKDTSIVEYHASIHGCDSIVRTEIEVASSDALSIYGPEVLCSESIDSLSATPTYEHYQWNTGAEERIIEIQQAGIYSLTVTNSAGCELTAEWEVTESAPVFSSQVIHVSCPGAKDGQILLSPDTGGASPYLYNINGNTWQTTADFVNLEAGIYTIGMQDARGCEYQEIIEINEGEFAERFISGVPESATDIGDTLHLYVEPVYNNDQLLWEGDGLISCDTCSEISWQPFSEGQMSLTITTPGGCIQQSMITLDLRDRYRVYFPNAFSPNGDGNNDTFSPGLGRNIKNVLQLEIYDRWGGQVFSSSTNDIYWDGQWKGQPLDAGLYLYRAEIEFTNGQSRQFTGEVALMR